MSDGLKAVYKLSAEIERLEAELADLRERSVVYKVRCSSCDGSGYMVEMIGSHPNLSDVPCPDCVDGWQLAEGVAKQLSTDGYDYVFPARLIEGDT